MCIRDRYVGGQNGYNGGGVGGLNGNSVGGGPSLGNAPNGGGATAVSYTHLDVYKRQD